MGKVYINKKRESEIRDLILKIAVIKGRAMELEMYRTGHLLNDALNHSGWELARLLGEERTK